MQIESRTDTVKRLRTHIVGGETNLPDIKRFLENLYLSNEFDPTFDALWDMREADFSAVTPAEIKEMAYFARVNWAEQHRRKTALVISGDLHFGLSRMFEQFIGPVAHGKIKTFRDLPLATEWIDARTTVPPYQAEG